MHGYLFRTYPLGGFDCRPLRSGKTLTFHIKSSWEFIKLFDDTIRKNKICKIALGIYSNRERGYIVIGITEDGIQYPFGWVNKKRGLRLPRIMVDYGPRYLYG